MPTASSGSDVRGWLLQWVPWIVPKIPLLVAVAYAARVGFASDWGRQPLPVEEAIQAIFAMLVLWFTSEGLEVVLNRWRYTDERITNRIEALERTLLQRLEILQSQWGVPIVGQADIINRINEAVCNRDPRPRVIRFTHVPQLGIASGIHNQISLDQDARGGGRHGIEHQHLWRVDSEASFLALVDFIGVREQDERCLVKVTPEDLEAPNLELVLIGEYEAFVIVPAELASDGYVAYHLSGRRTVDPLLKLWYKWWESASELKTTHAIAHEHFAKLKKRFSGSATHATPSTQQLDQARFWQSLLDAIGNLPPGATLDEIRVGSALSLTRQRSCDEMIARALQDGILTHYRRIHLLASQDELALLQGFAQGQQGRQQVAVYVGVDRAYYQALPAWNMWLVGGVSAPEGVLYLYDPSANRTVGQPNCLEIKTPDLVAAYRTFLDDWWRNKPGNTTDRYGMMLQGGRMAMSPLVAAWQQQLGAGGHPAS